MYGAGADGAWQAAFPPGLLGELSLTEQNMLFAYVYMCHSDRRGTRSAQLLRGLERLVEWRRRLGYDAAAGGMGQRWVLSGMVTSLVFDGP